MANVHSPHRDRLWTPWRMRYISHDDPEDGCIFCNRRDRANDIQSLILHRAEHSFIIMNLYPYNTGHVMIVPSAHIDAIEKLDQETLAEMSALLPPLIRVLQRVLGCEGFNVGINQGDIAGAGVAEHLHQHVVPRWRGDANFMPIIAGTMVIPELIPSSYAKIRVELEVEMRQVDRIDVVLLDEEESPGVWLKDGDIPQAAVTGGTAAWRTATQTLNLDNAEIVGYSGAASTLDRDVSPGLVIRTHTAPDGDGWSHLPFASARGNEVESSDARETLNRVRKSLAPWIASPRTGNPVD